MTLPFSWRPTSMARRFALAAAGLAAATVLLISLASWWLINQAHLESLDRLAATERRFRAEAVGSDLQALAERISEMAESTILATGLVDSAGRETYLVPFLAGIRHINGVSVELLFTDFEGQEIASNGVANFDSPQLSWLRGELSAGHDGARIFSGARGYELVALTPLRYDRTPSPEGALFYKIALSDLSVGDSMALDWSRPDQRADPEPGLSATVPVPSAFDALGFRVRSRMHPDVSLATLAPQYMVILVIATLLFGAVVLVGAKLAKLMTLDLERLQDFARRVVASGLDGQRAPTQGSDEVAILATSINRMLDRLDEQHSTLLQEREKLSRLTDALRAADRRKDDFLAMLAHELRNPLAPIMTGAELLKRIPGSDKKVLQTSDIIARQAGHMREILDDLLDVSRVTRGLVTLDRTDLDYAAIAAMAVEQVRPLVEARDHQLTIDIAPEPIRVNGDRARLIQILSNLLTNAAKYTPEGGRIWLSVQSVDGNVRVDVKDSGDGIAPELMPDIFDLFSQGARPSDRQLGGLGLGLALVKNLAELHGGRISAHSAGVGCGATFTLELPLLATSGAQDDVCGPAVEQGETVRPLQLMLVDDNVDAASNLAALLETEGHSVHVVNDASTALQKLDDVRFDAFLLDIGLPGMDGYELARRIRVRPDMQGAILVAVTGYGQDSDRANALRAGFNHHLVKPVELQTLLPLLRVSQATINVP